MDRTRGKKVVVWALREWKAIVTSILTAVLVTACGAGTSTETDRDAITGAIESSELFAVDVTDDRSPDGAVYDASDRPPDEVQAAGAAADLPAAWGRGLFEHLQRDISISITGDTAAVVVTDRIQGSLFVDTTDDGERNPWVKPFEDVLTRHAEFTRLPDGWRLTKISPLDISLADPEQQTVRIQWIRASVDGVTVWESSSSSELFDVPAGLPVFSPLTEVLVEAKVVNSSPADYIPESFVFLHRPGGVLGRVRDRMFDDGSNGDRTASDGIFSRTYTIGQVPGRYFAAVDVIDAATLLDENAPYNSAAWGMPYIVEKPSAGPSTGAGE